MPMAATTPPPPKCIMLSSHGAFQYRGKIRLIICEAKEKQKDTSILLKFFPKIMLYRKKRMAIGSKPPSRSQVGALFNGYQILRRDSSSRQNNGLPRNKISRKFAPNDQLYYSSFKNNFNDTRKREKIYTWTFHVQVLILAKN